MMLEQVTTTGSYESFFTQCSPESCAYMIIERNNLVVIVTALIGAFSGLNIALKLLTPLIVRALFWCKGCMQGTFRPGSPRFN